MTEETASQQFIVCREPRGAQWQLGSLAATTGSVSLLGWRQTEQMVDAGVPDYVASVLAEGLTSVARVSFLTSQAGCFADDESAQELALERSLGERIRASLSRNPIPTTMVSTRHASTLKRLFYDEDFPWWLQGQVVLLAGCDDVPLTINAAHLLSLFQDDWLVSSASLAERGVLGVLRPGVDGDVAALLTFSDEFQSVLLGALENAAHARGHNWTLGADEESFARALSSS